MSVYIWSDLHFYHDKIRLYENRPFESVEKMNQILCKNWKETVKGQDTIINLGDVSLNLNKEQISKILFNLPGYKILIMGNHDKGKSVSWWMDVGFNEVYKYPIIYDSFYILSHEPLYINANMPYVNIHGHTHSEKSNNPQKINVSVEVLEYKPILFEEIKKIYAISE